MIKVRKIELLAPAKNLECGIEAINHGADAVYIGAPKFGARSAVGNSIDDIRQLVNHARQFKARVYVALNTVLKDNELSEAEKMIWDIYRAGADAIIVQDMGVLMMDLPPIPLHASTQVDNRNTEKIKFLERIGFSQIVLARELSINEIKNICSEISVPAEVFVHGALCVSYSGQCYISESICKRSANRGACAQYCRLPYALMDADGIKIGQEKHFLSMKDLNLSEHLEDLLDAGVSSFKIEGRLKDVSYVKNVTAYYRQKLDSVMEKRPEFQRSSSGRCTYFFEPDLRKSFNRGFTDYFLNGREPDIWSINSPKSTGEPVGKVKDVFDRFFILSGTKKLNNGDGLCFFNDKAELQGIRVNRVEGEKIFFSENNLKIRKGTLVYRNYDHEFEKLLGKKSAERKIDLEVTIRENSSGYAIDGEDEDGNMVSVGFDFAKETALKDQTENIRNNLSKTGSTVFRVTNIINQLVDNRFIPSSVLSEMRRSLTERLLQVRLISNRRPIVHINKSDFPYYVPEIGYTGNVTNEKSRLFYREHGTDVFEYGFEKTPHKDVPLMFTKHCIKFSLGICSKYNDQKRSHKEPFYLISDNIHLKLVFDCSKCEMKIYKQG